MSRELRQPIPRAEFDKLPLKVLTKRLAAPWWNLRWVKHADKARVFFASASGRLTPDSGKAPCLYLARTRETAFYEVYGDDLDAAEKRGKRHYFLRSELENRVFLKTTGNLVVRLYDLSAEKGASRIGMDLGTLYTPKVVHPRAFAQRLHDHPANFDGIQYMSRHTQVMCIVLWASHNPGLEKIRLETGQDLWESARFERNLPSGVLRLFSSEIGISASS